MEKGRWREILRKAGSCRFDRKERAGSTIYNISPGMSIEAADNKPFPSHTCTYHLHHSSLVRKSTILCGSRTHAQAYRVFSLESERTADTLHNVYKTTHQHLHLHFQPLAWLYSKPLRPCRTLPIFRCAIMTLAFLGVRLVGTCGRTVVPHTALAYPFSIAKITRRAVRTLALVLRSPEFVLTQRHRKRTLQQGRSLDC